MKSTLMYWKKKPQKWNKIALLSNHGLNFDKMEKNKIQNYHLFEFFMHLGH